MKINKYKVSEKLMNDINEWRDGLHCLILGTDLNFSQPSRIYNWWLGNNQGFHETNNRLIALIQYVNGEDVFEVDNPEKWIVRSKASDVNGDYYYLQLIERDGAFTDDVTLANSIYIDEDVFFATKFNTKEEAEQFTNPLMEAVEVEDE